MTIIFLYCIYNSTLSLLGEPHTNTVSIARWKNFYIIIIGSSGHMRGAWLNLSTVLCTSLGKISLWDIVLVLSSVYSCASMHIQPLVS